MTLRMRADFQHFGPTWSPLYCYIDGSKTKRRLTPITGLRSSGKGPVSCVLGQAERAQPGRKQDQRPCFASL
jgi:hypothetical protein